MRENKDQKLFIYEFKTKNNPNVTFLAGDDKVALVCVVLLSGGEATCSRRDEQGNSISINSCLLYNHEADKTVEKELGMKLSLFIDKNREKINECYLSFAYVNIQTRPTFDDAVQAITDEEKKKIFKEKHLQRNINDRRKWVKTAWAYGDNNKKQIQR